MKYLFAVQDTFGHLLPAIRLATLIQAQGHDVLIVSTDRHGVLMDLHGIAHVAVSNSADVALFFSTKDWYVPYTVRTQLDVLESAVAIYGPDVIVTSPLIMSSYLIAERHRLPVVVIGYAEYLYPGVDDPNPTRQWRLDSITGFYNECRRLLGLAPVAVDSESTPLIGNRYLLRNVPEFTTPRNLPHQVRHVGGLYWEPECANPALERFVLANRRAGRRIVYVQIGRLFGKREIWSKLMDALDALDVACVADTGRSDYLPPESPIPPHCFVSRFLPIGFCAEAIDAVICSGHSAVLLGALTHRKPILCIPTSADSTEISDRVLAHGLGARLEPMDGVEAWIAQLAKFLERARNEEFMRGLARYGGLLDDWKRREASVVTVALATMKATGHAPIPAFAQPFA